MRSACRGCRLSHFFHTLLPVSDHRDYYRGRKVLVTGGLGFIGSNLGRTLADLGASVTAVDSLLPDYGGNLFNLDGYEDKGSASTSPTCAATAWSTWFAARRFCSTWRGR